MWNCLSSPVENKQDCLSSSGADTTYCLSPQNVEVWDCLSSPGADLEDCLSSSGFNTKDWVSSPVVNIEDCLSPPSLKNQIADYMSTCSIKVNKFESSSRANSLVVSPRVPSFMRHPVNTSTGAGTSSWPPTSHATMDLKIVPGSSLRSRLTEDRDPNSTSLYGIIAEYEGLFSGRLDSTLAAASGDGDKRFIGDYLGDESETPGVCCNQRCLPHVSLENVREDHVENVHTFLEQGYHWYHRSQDIGVTQVCSNNLGVNKVPTTATNRSLESNLKLSLSGRTNILTHLDRLSVGVVSPLSVGPKIASEKSEIQNSSGECSTAAPADRGDNLVHTEDNLMDIVHAGYCSEHKDGSTARALSDRPPKSPVQRDTDHVWLAPPDASSGHHAPRGHVSCRRHVTTTNRAEDRSSCSGPALMSAAARFGYREFTSDWSRDRARDSYSQTGGASSDGDRQHRMPDSNSNLSFCFRRKNTLILRTQLTVRVHAIIGKTLLLL